MWIKINPEILLYPVHSPRKPKSLRRRYEIECTYSLYEEDSG